MVTVSLVCGTAVSSNGGVGASWAGAPFLQPAPLGASTGVDHCPRAPPCAALLQGLSRRRTASTGHAHADHSHSHEGCAAHVVGAMVATRPASQHPPLPTGSLELAEEGEPADSDSAGAADCPVRSRHACCCSYPRGNNWTSGCSDEVQHGSLLPVHPCADCSAVTCAIASVQPYAPPLPPGCRCMPGARPGLPDAAGPRGPRGGCGGGLHGRCRHHVPQRWGWGGGAGAGRGGGRVSRHVALAAHRGLQPGASVGIATSLRCPPTPHHTTPRHHTTPPTPHLNPHLTPQPCPPVIIGLTLGVTSGTSFTTLLIAIVLHQLFEGLAIGSAAVDAGVGAARCVALGCAYSLTTPVGIAVGEHPGPQCCCYTRVSVRFPCRDPAARRLPSAMSAAPHRAPPAVQALACVPASTPAPPLPCWPPASWTPCQQGSCCTWYWFSCSRPCSQTATGCTAGAGRCRRQPLPRSTAAPA